ncbi:hypothetical protein BV25DRAFT_1909551 [Artomyces pyxidatus]|uniref:Uncharacterized protein n=1 Tax=Artomyces pyxidatus TaxID=48021 RepID=A0ACB8SNC0_9AGAM|nr:hypothetical protein BV25DRAFT_1909551 [Artomyces pyxidatus]
MSRLSSVQLPPRPYTLARRQITSTSSLHDQQTVFKDPSHEGLFYHLVPPPTPLSETHPVFAVSLLETPPTHSTSSTILGWLPAETPGEEDTAGLNDFRENPRFRPLLHEAISSALADGADDIQINGAIQTGNGWMHIHDTRNVPALGRIGDPDDILGTVLVEDGKIQASTYSPMPSYRLCTSDGVTRLTEGLDQRLKSVLARTNEEERAAARRKGGEHV